MKCSKLLSILFIAGTLTLGLTVSQSVFASDQGGPPGGPHHGSDFPPKSPQGDTPGNPHIGIVQPPPGYGDPHTGEERGKPHIGDKKGNPHEFSPIPAHAKGIGPVGEPASNNSHGEPESNDSHGEATFTDFPGEATSNDFPGEAFSNVSFGES